MVPKKLNLKERNFKCFNEREFVEIINTTHWDEILQLEKNDPNTPLEKNDPNTSLEKNDPNTSLEKNDPNTSLEKNDPNTSLEKNDPNTSLENLYSHLNYILILIIFSMNLHPIKRSLKRNLNSNPNHGYQKISNS